MSDLRERLEAILQKARNQDRLGDVDTLTEAIASLPSATGEPQGYAVREGDYWAGIWNEYETAQLVASKSKGAIIVPLFGASVPSPLRVEAGDTQDAARYRWLVNHGGFFAEGLRKHLSYKDGKWDYDAAIDAAMLSARDSGTRKEEK